MQHVRLLKFGVATAILGLAAFASGSAAAKDVNMWDGDWHFEVSPYAWAPFIYPTVQLPDAAGGGTTTPEIQPSQYLKHVKGGALLAGNVRKGDWALWTDVVYLNLQNNTTHIREIGVPGFPVTLPVTRALNADLRAAIWTLAPSYTVLNNDFGTVDVLAGMRYFSLRASLSYEFTAPPTPLMRGGGFWPSADTTEGIFGFKGAVRVTRDGKWFVPYEADAGVGNGNWGWNAFLGIGYHFHWGDVTLGGRNLSFLRSGGERLQTVRMTGPLLGASFRW